MTAWEFQQRMTRIADANHDVFETTHHCLDKSRWQVHVVERQDGHAFVSGVGATVEAACAAALSSLPAALSAWDYKDMP